MNPETTKRITLLDGREYHHHGDEVECPDLATLARLACGDKPLAWSRFAAGRCRACTPWQHDHPQKSWECKGCIEVAHHRCNARFVETHYLGFDVDEGISLAEAIEKLASYRAFIAPSKSHQTEKPVIDKKTGKVTSVRPPCDRFHLFFELSEPITSKAVYQGTWLYIRDALGVGTIDEQCKDPARFFWQSTRVEWSNPDGTPLVPVAKTAKVQKAYTRAKTGEPDREELDTTYAHSGWADETILERARKYLAKLPPSIEGQGGRKVLWDACLALARGFLLPNEQSLPLLAQEVNTRAEPRWTEEELVEKLENARVEGRKTPGYMFGDTGCLLAYDIIEADETGVRYRLQTVLGPFAVGRRFPTEAELDPANRSVLEVPYDERSASSTFVLFNFETERWHLQAEDGGWGVGYRSLGAAAMAFSDRTGRTHPEASGILKAGKYLKVSAVRKAASPAELVPVAGERYPILNVAAKEWVEPVEGAFPNLERILTHLLSEEPEARDWLENWLACGVQHPDEPLKTAVVLYGRAEGSGKTLFATLYAVVRGGDWQAADQSDLTANWNDRLAHANTVIYDEVTLEGTRGVDLQKLRLAVSEPEVTQKKRFTNDVSIRNRRAVFVCSNDPNPVTVNEGDRRFAFIRVPEPSADHKSTVQEFRAQWEGRWHECPELAAWKHHLCQRSTDRKRVLFPYESKARATVIEANRSLPELFTVAVQAKQVSLLSFDPAGWASASSVQQAYQQWCLENDEKPKPTKLRLSNALLALGWRDEIRNTGRFLKLPKTPASKAA